VTTLLPTAAVSVPSALVVLPAPPGKGLSPDTMIAGLPLLRRIVLAATRAGFERILVHPRACPAPALLEGTGAIVLDGRAGTPAPERVVLLPVNVLPQARWLRGLREMPLEPETILVDSSMVAAMESAVGGDVLRTVGECSAPHDLIASLSQRLPNIAPAGDPAGRFAVDGAGGVKAAEDWLLRGLIKDTEGFMSRHVERRISLALTRRLVNTRITPNLMTLVSLAMGLTGAPFFLSVDPLMQVIGSLLFLTHSILDGCDGELARLKFLESRAGARLDFWGDNLVHVAVFTCMGVGWSMAIDALWPLVLGMLAVAGTGLSAVLVSQQSGAPSASGARLAEALANRDFIYLVIVLACFGKAQWFLVCVALGTPIFMMLVRWGAGRRRAK
jgi:1L-myo-inositol 1-phosphate cytidylyltransferase / CDP-L-myo-inositol myo-inositolphosphotransferase